MDLQDICDQLKILFPREDILSRNPTQLYWPDREKTMDLMDTNSIPFVNIINFLQPGSVNYTHEYHCAWFNLDDEKDRELYCLVNQRAVNGWYFIMNKQHETADGKLRIWLEWRQTYAIWIPGEEVLL